METRENWEWEVIKLTEEMSKMSGRICLLENFIKEQFGNIFWNFCEKAAAAITPTSIGLGTAGHSACNDSPTNYSNHEKYPLNLKNYSLLKSNQSQADCTLNDGSRTVLPYEKNQSSHPKLPQKAHQVQQRLPTQRFSPQTITASLENSPASTLHPKLHHQLTVERNKLHLQPTGSSSLGISGTKLMLSNVSLPPSITITSVQGAQEDRESVRDNQYCESALKSHLLTTSVLHSSTGGSNKPFSGSQKTYVDDRVRQQHNMEDNSNEPFYSEVDVGPVKAEHDSYGEDSPDEDGGSPCAMEIKLDPTTIDFSDDYTEGSEDNEHSQNYGYESLSYEEKVQFSNSGENVDGKLVLKRNSPGSSSIRTPTRPRRDVMQPTPCHAKCQNKCAEWSHGDRLKVFNSYTVLPSVQHKEAWIMSNLERTEIAKKKTLYSNFRTCTFKYYLPHPNFGSRQVCKAFFCATIGEPRNIVEKTAKALKSNTEDSNGVKPPIPFARRVPEKRRKPNSSSSLDFTGSVSNMMSNIHNQNQPTIKNYDSSDNSLS